MMGKKETSDEVVSVVIAGSRNTELYLKVNDGIKSTFGKVLSPVNRGPLFVAFSKSKVESYHIAPPDTLTLEIGLELIPLVENDKGTNLIKRIQRVRREIALTLGIVFPKIRIIDNTLLDSSEYCIKIRGVEMGRGTIRLGHYLCIKPDSGIKEIPGEKTLEPAFGLPAVWIIEELRDEANRLGYTVVDPLAVIATHLSEIINRHAAEILDRQTIREILEELQKDYPAVVADAYSPPNRQGGSGLSLGGIKKVLQNLLREQVSIRNIVSILETVADFSRLSNNTRFITEKVRQALGSQICRQYADKERRLHVMTIDPRLEQKIVERKVQNSDGDIVADLKPALHRAWRDAVRHAVKEVKIQGFTPVILCTEQARYMVRSLLEQDFFHTTAVLSPLEITPDYKVESIRVIRIAKRKPWKIMLNANFLRRLL
jgi:flagellar biosynthesis protein FlhA